MIIVDEAHRVLADTYNSNFKSERGRNKIGWFTATPGRGTQDIDENKLLSEFSL